MSRNKNTNVRAGNSDRDLAGMVVRVAQAAQATAIICATETGKFAKHLHDLSEQVNLIAATTNRETYDDLVQGGLEAIRLPLRAIDKYSQIHHIISVALKANRVSIGDIVACL